MEDIVVKPWFPLSAHPFVLFCFFASCLVIFHVLLVWVFKIGKLAWKYVDYIWLGITVLSLFGASMEVRRLVASSQVEMLKSVRDVRYQYMTCCLSLVHSW